MKIYLVSYIHNDYKFNTNYTRTKYFLNENDTLDYLVNLHDNEYCLGGEEIKKRKKCKYCGWKKGLNNMLSQVEVYFRINILVNIIDTDQIEPQKGLEIKISCSYDNVKNEIK